jgi:hypothetical protein
MLQGTADDLGVSDIAPTSRTQSHSYFFGTFLVKGIDLAGSDQSRQGCGIRTPTPHLGQRGGRDDNPGPRCKRPTQDRLEIFVTPFEGDQGSGVEDDIS